MSSPETFLDSDKELEQPGRAHDSEVQSTSRDSVHTSQHETDSPSLGTASLQHEHVPEPHRNLLHCRCSSVVQLDNIAISMEYLAGMAKLTHGCICSSAIGGSMQRQRHFAALTVRYCVAADVTLQQDNIRTRTCYVFMQADKKQLQIFKKQKKTSYRACREFRLTWLVTNFACQNPRSPAHIGLTKSPHLRTTQSVVVHFLGSERERTELLLKPQKHEASPSPCTSNMFCWRSGVANRSAR